MSIKIESTTDTEEAVIAATGNLVIDKDVEETEEPAKGSDDAAADAVEDTEDLEDTDSTDEGEDDSVKGAKSKRRGGYQRKIEKLKQETDYWREQALKSGQKDAEKSQPVVTADSATNQRPDADEFETHEDYVEAVADWKFEKKLAERDAKTRETNLITEQQQRVDSFKSQVEKFKVTASDFDQVIEDVDDIPLSLAVQTILLDSDNGPELMYELAKDPEEYERICSLTPMAAARAIGRVEAKLTRSSEKQETKKTTKAPKPINPLKSGSSGISSKSPDEMSFREYERWFEKAHG